MDDFREQVKVGFKACKTDIESLRTENSVLRDRIFLVEQQNRNLKDENSNFFAQISELKSELKGLSIAIEYIKEFTSKQTIFPVDDFTQAKRAPVFIDEPIVAQVKPKSISTKSQDPYEALLAFKAKANKREILKQKLISMIGESGMNLSELKFMFVEHFRYCSKASFYNYLKELELEKTVKVERENSRNFIYLLGLRKEI